ncbi:MAG: SRPBCC family protein [Burkholderiaceae bacterium]
MSRRLIVILLGLIVLTALGSLLLPAEQKVERSLVINEPADRIWALIVDPPAWNRWSPWHEDDPNMKITYQGAPKGEGARWRWESARHGSGDMQIVRADVPREMNYVMTLNPMGATYGRFVLEPADGGTRVVWTHAYDAGYNPIARWTGLFMENWVGPSFEKGLSNMAKALSIQAK